MAIKSSGSLSFSEIASEFGDTAPHSMSEFVRGGGKVPQAGANGNIPTSAAVMRFSHFFGAVNVIAYTASNGTNLNASTAFGSSWSDNVPKELIIPSGVTIGSSSSGTAALILPTGMGGTLTIYNAGSIHGAGGSANGGTGGTAILAESSSITIDNTGGIIYGGGGGGGQGGTGGQGRYVAGYNYEGGCGYRNSCGPTCDCKPAGSYCTNCSGPNDNDKFICGRCAIPSYAITSGGTGGTGGVGQGYNQSAATGSGGSAGGNSAGAGGTGGTAGAFGASGSTGSTGANGNYSGGSGGSSGGLAGYYVSGIGNVTFSVNGTTAGRTV